MGDRLTQLQDAVDQVRVLQLKVHLHFATFHINRPLQLAQQFVACIHYVNWRHDLETLGPKDEIRDLGKRDPSEMEGQSGANPTPDGASASET